jgi:hypothetical protein
VTVARGTALALGLVALFVLTTLSTVKAREPIDAAVTRSFDSAAPRIASGDAKVAPLGCHKRSIDTYDCDAVVIQTVGEGMWRPRYGLSLRDDGCWTGTDQQAVTPPPVAHEVRGCIDD